MLLIFEARPRHQLTGTLRLRPRKSVAVAYLIVAQIYSIQMEIYVTLSSSLTRNTAHDHRSNILHSLQSFFVLFDVVL